MRPLAFAALTLVAAGCRYPDPLTAVEHERIAASRRAEANKAEATVRIQETTRPMPSATEAASDPSVPMVDYAGARAAVEVEAARKHEAAAERIRHDAELACARVPPAERSVCPVGEVVRVRPLAGGARLFVKAPPPGESWQARVGCAQAEARVDRPLGGELCPLLVEGAEAHVVDDGAGGVALEITARDDAHGAEIRRRAEALRPR